jgi:hypothetical protein
MKIFRIGFTKKSAETFFTRLNDVRLSNASQLAGFTKKDDLRYFTQAICNIDYVHLPELAPAAAAVAAQAKRTANPVHATSVAFADQQCLEMLIPGCGAGGSACFFPLLLLTGHCTSASFSI